MNRVLSRLSNALLFAQLLMAAPAAQATLGEKDTSVEQVRTAFGAARHAPVQVGSYTVHEVANAGLTIREYAGQDGVIFAVAWSGVTHPDLTSILGTYMGEFAQASGANGQPRARRGMAEVRGANIVVVKSGHMRAVHGRAYIPNLLPAGVTGDDIN